VAPGSVLKPSRFPIPARLNLAIGAAQIAVLLALDWLAGRLAFGWCVLVLAPLYGVAMNSVYALLHEAEHNILHPDRRVNEWAGVLLALFFPAPFHLLRQGHLGHHLRNRSDDEAFDLYFGEGDRLWKSLQFYGGIMTGLYWVVVALTNLIALVRPGLVRGDAVRFDRSTAALLDSLNPKYVRLIQLEAAAAVALHVAIVWAFAIPPLHYLVVLFGFGFMWSSLQYVHHFDTVRDVLRGARNLATWAPLDAVWLNHNYHLNHHLNPTVPWIHLPALQRGPGYERTSLLAAYLRMWRGPRWSGVRVQNRYAGVVIR
jgi:fatty acid desaturase